MKLTSLVTTNETTYGKKSWYKNSDSLIMISLLKGSDYSHLHKCENRLKPIIRIEPIRTYEWKNSVYLWLLRCLHYKS